MKHESHELANQTNKKLEYICEIRFIRDIRGKE